MSKQSNEENAFDISTSGKYTTRLEDNRAKEATDDSYDQTFSHVSSKGAKCLNFLKSLKIETFAFIVMFSFYVRSVTTISLIMEKCCRVEFAFGDYICSHLDEKELEPYKTQVETVANNYHLYVILITFTPAVLLAPFVGPWSDKYGRKPPLIIALLGILIDGMGTFICAYYVESSVKLLLIPPIFSGLSGGLVAISIMIYSYVPDVTDANSRTLRYTLLELGSGLGSPLGSLAGGWIFKFGNYIPVFACTVIGTLCGLAWVLFILVETKGHNNKDTLREKFLNFFSLTNFVAGFKATSKWRPHKGRAQIFALMIVTSFAVVSITSSTVGYIYVYHLYNWSNTRFSTISAIFSVFSLIAMMIAVPLLTKVFKFGDPTLGLLGSLSSVIKYLGMGLGMYGQGIYYIAHLFGMLSSLTTLAGRSRITKIVSKNDFGKVFAFISAAEGILPVLATIFVTRLYNATVASGNPGITFYVMACLLAVDVAIYIWLACLPTVNYGEMQAEQENTIDGKELPKYLEDSRT